MFEPWREERLITVEQRYRTPNPAIPRGRRAVAFRPAKNGERFLGTCLGVEVTANTDYASDSPVIILAPALTEIEECYGEGETAESVWAKHCPFPEKYGKPQFGKHPAGVPLGIVLPKFTHFPPDFQEFPEQPRISTFDYVYAPLLNDWQQLYGEAITDAAALEAKLRAEGKLEKSQVIERNLREPALNEAFVSKDTGNPLMRKRDDCVTYGPRAIVGTRTRKRRYLKVPLTIYGEIKTHIRYEAGKCEDLLLPPASFPGAEIVEE